MEALDWQGWLAFAAAGYVRLPLNISCALFAVALIPVVWPL